MYRKTEKLAGVLSAQEQRRLFSFADRRPAADLPEGESYSYWRSTAAAFCRNRTAVFFLAVMLAVVAFSLLQPLLPGQLPAAEVNNDPVTGLPCKNLPPGRRFWLGTNEIGQDLWARLWAGTRTSLFIGFSVAGIEALVGVAVGVAWGYIRALDVVLTELYNVTDNIPTTIVLILLSYIMRPGLGTIIFSLSLTGWIGMARFVRNQVVILRDRDFVLASRCLGTPTARVIIRGLLPHLVSVVALRAALSIPAAIGSEVFITYIGLGLPANLPSLGNLLNAGRKLMMSRSLRYQLVFPAAVLSLVTVSFYLVGSALADAADPRNHR